MKLLRALRHSSPTRRLDALRRVSLIAGLLPMLLSSCFTGVESTPKITAADVRREGVVVSEEQKFGARFTGTPLASWNQGRELLVVNPKIRLVLSSANTSRMPDAGDRLRYAGYRTSSSLTGTEIVELIFTSSASPADTLLYRTNIAADALTQATKVSVPFTIDLAMLKSASRLLLGNEYYLQTSLRYSVADGQPIKGRKFVKVRVTDVVPGDETNPIAIVFADDRGEPGMLLMGPADSPTSRTFQSILALDTPRRHYPEITDEVWTLITESRVRQGMTRPECRLALGAPTDVDHGRDYSSAYERWTYPDGLYLIFQDGMLSDGNFPHAK